MNLRSILAPRFVCLLAIACELLLSAGWAKPEDVKLRTRVVYAIVALADNATQGLVPVPPKIGNGDDAANNLYWGCDEGLKATFSRSKDWKLVSSIKAPRPCILERLVFRHASGSVHLVADAYRGSEMKQAIGDLLGAASGELKESVRLGGDEGDVELRIAGGADLIAFIGHNGLMDFRLDALPKHADRRLRDAIVLCCKSRKYFQPALHSAGARPLLLTTDLMYPGSFILKSALDGWIKKETPEQIRERAAQVYAKNQGCGIKGARGLLVTGWE